MATHASMLAWEIPWIEQPGRLQSMWSQKSWTRLATKGQTVGLHESVKSLGTTDRKVCTLLLSSMSSTKCSQQRARSIEKASLNGAVWRKKLEGTAVNAKTSSKPIYHIFSYRSKTVICRQKQQQQKTVTLGHCGKPLQLRRDRDKNSTTQGEAEICAKTNTIAGRGAGSLGKAIPPRTRFTVPQIKA